MSNWMNRFGYWMGLNYCFCTGDLANEWHGKKTPTSDSDKSINLIATHLVGDHVLVRQLQDQVRNVVDAVS
jgi:hypothetical protein